MLEATRPNKDRINISIPNASESYSMNIRKFTNFIPTPDMMLKSGTVNEEIQDFLWQSGLDIWLKDLYK